MAGYVGADEHQDYTVMGDVVNVAKRLQEAAGAGRIVVSNVLAEALAARFECSELPPFPARGKAQPILARLLRREIRSSAAVPREALTGRTVIPPLVGRSQEWRRLLEIVEEAQQGRGRVVVLRGEAGVGKSRMKFEVRSHCKRKGFAIREGSATDAAHAMGPF